jgi:hypothetical protein
MIWLVYLVVRLLNSSSLESGSPNPFVAVIPKELSACLCYFALQYDSILPKESYWSCFAERLACKLALFWYRVGGLPL